MDSIAHAVRSPAPLVHATAGMVGGAMAISLFYPVESIRSQLPKQSRSDACEGSVFSIIKRLGMSGLYEGWQPSVLCLGASNFVFYYSYNLFKAIFRRELVKRRMSPEIPTLMILIIAAASGVINVVITLPLWHAKLQLNRYSKYKGVIDCLRHIYEKHGLGELYDSLWPSLTLVANPSIQWAVYENLRRFMVNIAKRRGFSIRPMEFFVMAAIAKGFATALTYPLQLAQARLRHDRKKAKEQRSYWGTYHALVGIYCDGGVKKCFEGIEATIWPTVLTAAFQLLGYELISKLLRRFLHRGVSKPTPT